jgi:hypothetical protein
MTVTILVDGQKLFLNPFITSFTANLLVAIAKSMHPQEASKVELRMKDQELQLKLDGDDIPVNAGRAQKIVGNVLRGLLSSLHGAESGNEFVFSYEKE